MLSLGLDTALGALSVAVVKDGAALAHEWREMPRGHAEALAPSVQKLMAAAGVAFADLDRIAVTTGPGTFTGQRVGLAFARALSLAIGKPAIGITTLDAMAEEALVKAADATWAVVAADAKRGEIYLGARSRSGETVIAPELIEAVAAPARVAALRTRMGAQFALAGTAAEMMLEPFRAAGLDPVLSPVRQPDALYVARLGERAAPGLPPKPLYLRAPDAKLPGTA